MTQTTIGALFVMLGTLLVGGGGLLATYGWQKVSSGRQWQNSIRSVIRELNLNEKIIEAGDDTIKERIAGTIDARFPAESFHDVQLTGALTSGIWNPDDEADKAVADAIDRYRQDVAHVNAGLRIVGRTTRTVYLKPDLVVDSEWLAKKPGNHINARSEQFAQLVESHKAAKAALKSKYPWAF
ncbi:MAG: hypothetical protein JNL18_10400 [Planctomycetaceae bacterium]|uniref:Uncharacterized protein n=1 Tax=Lacipirellula limnantheis TaxID=2528024 RepID=A0A517TV28_9BACT|nr:hypothetical protein [Lacipirellula limnantheis]MBL9163134.1 hypothetical protein [Planctomycetaceae bacterium]QDT72207.1 hypothetical protein I41_13770 [Lacipirellula limnantheis]